MELYPEPQIRVGIMEQIEFCTNDYFIHTVVKKYLAPSVLALAGTTITIVANSLMVGNWIGAEALAAINLLNPVYFLFATFGALINVGASTCAAGCIGRKKEDRAAGYATLALVLSIVIPLVVSVFGLVFFSWVSQLLGTPEQLSQLVCEYGRILMAGGVTIVFMYYPFNFAKIDGRPNLGTYMFGLMFVLDLLFGILFLRILHMGISGMALAFVLSTLIGDLAGLWMLLIPKKRMVRLGKIQDGVKMFVSLVETGSSMALNNVCNIFKMLLLNYLIGAMLGGVGLTVFAVVGTINSFSNSLISGVAQTITPLIGVFYGEKDNISIERVIAIAKRMGCRLMFLMTFFLCVVSPWLGNLFGIGQGEEQRMLIPALCLFAFSFVPGVLNHIYIFHYFTTEKIFLANILTFLRGFGVLALAAKICQWATLGNAIWFSFAVAEIMTLGILYLISYCMEQKNANLSHLTLLDRLYEDRERYLAFSVENDITQAAETSQKVSQFCESWKIDPKLQMSLALSVEELLVLIFEHCFAKGTENYVDIRIVKTDTGVLLRMRNDGTLFDPLEYYRKMCKKADGEEEMMMSDSLGIQMLESCAEEILYTNTFGFNHLLVTL